MYEIYEKYFICYLVWNYESYVFLRVLTQLIFVLQKYRLIATNVRNSVKLQQVDQVPETEVALAVVLAKWVSFEVQPGLNPTF